MSSAPSSAVEGAGAGDGTSSFFEQASVINTLAARTNRDLVADV
jgi:hypothetical protein